jgi:hypothetical protein
MTEQNNELNENYRQILDQVEILGQNSNFAADPAIKNSFKIISDRLKRLLPDETATTLDETLNENSNPSSVESKNETIVENDDHLPSSSIGGATEEVESTIMSSSNIDSLDIRITYESPLEMMRSNKTKYAHQQETNSQLNNLIA